KDLIPHIDQTYRTIAKREGRIVEGFSMGGSGAAKWGFKHPDLFCGIGVMAGALLSIDSMTQRDGGGTFQRLYGGSREYFETNDPWTLAEKNADAVRGKTAIRIVVGANDGLREPNTTYHELLDRLNIEHEFHVIEGAAHSHAPLYDGLGDENWAYYRKAFGMKGAETEGAAGAVAQASSPEKPTASPVALPSSKPAAAPKPGFQLNGERWTWEGGGLSLKGILLKPEGDGPFPAIVISHGMGGSAESFALSKAREMVQWGFVCIGTDYTHAGRGEFAGQRRGARPGAEARGAGKAAQSRPSSGPASRPSFPRGPGGAPAERFSDAGASPENLRRAMKCIEILKSLSYVDSKRICAYGNSMGAFLTIALAANAPDDIACAAITAGGVRSGEEGAFASPTEQTAERIRCPFLIFHGTADTTVRPEMSERLKEILDKNGVPNERVTFEGIGHNAHMEKAEDVYRIMREWLTKHGALKQ
ncbi:MAG: prolyl oligopeptidase family serine peptidase, partial [Candidatus Sumerlaeota bacterium]|nr:prolyl oligopeptidase family serine peptidase [Candidatus Sumerlaeota bacterium]